MKLKKNKNDYKTSKNDRVKKKKKKMIKKKNNNNQTFQHLSLVEE